MLVHSSRFPSLGIPRLELENPRWNTYVGHWNSNVGIIASLPRLARKSYIVSLSREKGKVQEIAKCTSYVYIIILMKNHFPVLIISITILCLSKNM